MLGRSDMREPGIEQAHEPEHPIEVIPSDPRAVDVVRNTRVSENKGTNLELTELTQEVYRLTERAKNLLGLPDFDLGEEPLHPDALAALARVEAQSEWKMTERFDMPRCQAPSAGPEPQDVKNIHEVLRQKEQEVAALQAEIDALRIVVPLLCDSQDRSGNSPWVVSRSRQPVRIP
jgi:hypothetical protein